MSLLALLAVTTTLQHKPLYETLPLPANPKTYAARLKGKGYAFAEEGEVLTIIRKQKAAHLRLTGTLNVMMQPSGVPDVWLARVKIKGLPRAVISVVYQPVDKDNKRLQASYAVFRGSKAAASVEPVKRLSGVLKSSKLPLGSGERAVTVYTAPGFKKGGPAIFMSNGHMLEPFAQVLEALVVKKAARPVAIVGFHHGGGGVATQEYSASDEAAYKRHMSWVVDTVVPYAQKNFGVSGRRGDLTIFGFSSGAEFAGAAALQHPDKFGHAWLFSVPMPNTNRFVSPRPGSGVLFRLTAGTLEGPLSSTQAYAKSLEGIGKVEMRPYVGGHDLAPWLVEFERLVRAVYGG
jgi:enterochelin esterase-like enzyme